MLSVLKFVKGAIAKKTFHPALEHFHIGNGLIKGYNGVVGLCSPITLDIEACPEATTFVRAISSCPDGEPVTMHLTKAGRLSIKSGNFKILVPCLDSDLADIQPEGKDVFLPENFLSTLKTLYQYTAEDASRKWACGVLFRGQSAFATNNVILVEKWVGEAFPFDINIPNEALKELVRINKQPVRLQVLDNRATFHFDTPGQWLTTRLQETEWPDITPILNVPSQPTELPQGFFEELERLLPFLGSDPLVSFHDKGFGSLPGADVEAHIEMPGLPENGLYNAKQLLSLKKIIKQIDLTTYPKPCLFTGDKLRGAIIGRMA